MKETDVIMIQLGRKPRGEYTIAALCPYGLPTVIRTKPLIDDREPFPTLYWLTCPAASRACGALESSGHMQELNASLEHDAELLAAYGAAHDAYIADRDRDGVLADRVSAGGMPDRVKCVHALLAHEYATGVNPIGKLVAERIGPLDSICPGDCVIEDGHGVAIATPGHPHMKGKH